MGPVPLESVARAICTSQGFTFLEKVGSGAFKETFWIKKDGGDRALKVFQPDFSPERTAREVDALMRCSHPNIAKLESVARFTLSGKTFFFAVEEFIPGGTLTTRVRSRGLLTRDELYALGTALTGAVAHIASHRLVHRDIKPDNVLLRGDGSSPVIVDFGLVRNLDLKSLTQTWLHRGPGTPYFSPPEQLNNEKAYIDWRADQFSLGVTLSVVGFGFHPFEAPGVQMPEVVDSVAQRKPMADRFCAAVDAAQLPVLKKMVSPWPVERIRKPEDFVAAWVDQRR